MTLTKLLLKKIYFTLSILLGLMAKSCLHMEITPRHGQAHHTYVKIQRADPIIRGVFTAVKHRLIILSGIYWMETVEFIRFLVRYPQTMH